MQRDTNRFCLHNKIPPFVSSGCPDRVRFSDCLSGCRVTLWLREGNKSGCTHVPEWKQKSRFGIEAPVRQSTSRRFVCFFRTSFLCTAKIPKAWKKSFDMKRYKPPKAPLKTEEAWSDFCQTLKVHTIKGGGYLKDSAHDELLFCFGITFKRLIFSENKHYAIMVP